MRPSAIGLSLGALLAAALSTPATTWADEVVPGDKHPPAAGPVARTPDLAEIIPLASNLSQRLTALKLSTAQFVGTKQLNLEIKRFENRLLPYSATVRKLGLSRTLSYRKIRWTKKELKKELASFKVALQPLNKALQQLGSWRDEWHREKLMWQNLQGSLAEKQYPERIRSNIKAANNTIDAALQLILRRLGVLLTEQERAARLMAKMNTHIFELDSIISAEQKNVMRITSPPIFSSRYFRQFSGKLWGEAINGLKYAPWPSRQFLSLYGEILLLQCLFFALILIGIYLRRAAIRTSDSWKHLVERPFAVAVFYSTVMSISFSYYGEVVEEWQLVSRTLLGISFARYWAALFKESWKRHFVYGLAAVSILDVLVLFIRLPPPLSRIYILIVTVAGATFCWRWSRVIARQGGWQLHRWLLHSFSLFLIIIAVAEAWGKSGPAEYMFLAVVETVAVVILVQFLLRLIRNALESLYRAVQFKQTWFVHFERDTTLRRVMGFVTLVLFGFGMVPAVLMSWKVFNSYGEGIAGFLEFGFTLGGQKITIGVVLVAVGIFYGAFLVSWIIQNMLVNELIFGQRRIERGIRISMARLVHYLLVLVGFILAIATLGFEITKLTIILSALGIGIGFGLQGVVNNFVSGLVLLFERPIRVGDTIEMAGQWADVKRIGLRSTIVRTYDLADVIVPNSDLVSNQVTNWTLSSRLVRLSIPVGVAYGSDVQEVMKTLLSCARTNDKVASSPEPQVLFLNFGESSLDFELRVWVVDAEHRLTVSSELHQHIDQSFRDANIVIAFPQRDLHLRKVDDPAGSGS